MNVVESDSNVISVRRQIAQLTEWIKWRVTQLSKKERAVGKIALCDVTVEQADEILSKIVPDEYQGRFNFMGNWLTCS